MQPNVNIRSSIVVKSVVTFFSLLFLCSCAHQKNNTPQNITTQTIFSSHSSSKSAQEDAKQFDTLVPMGFRCTSKRLSSSLDNQILLVRYEGTQSLSRITTFYRRELEAAGWDFSDFSSDNEGLFFCRKGKQECAITIINKGKCIVTFSSRVKTPTQARLVSDISQINKPLSA